MSSDRPPAAPAEGSDPASDNGAAPRTIAQRVGLARAEAQSYYERGLRAFGVHSYEDALADLDAAIERAPGYAELFTARGLIALEAGKLPGAKEDFEYALGLSKRQWLAYYGLGTLAAGRNDWEEAIAMFTKAQAIAPGRPEVWYCRAVAYYNQGEMEKAAADMKTALRWFPPNDRRRSDAQKWLKLIDPTAAEAETKPEKSSEKSGQKDGKAAKSERGGGHEKAQGALESGAAGGSKHKQIESGRSGAESKLQASERKRE